MGCKSKDFEAPQTNEKEPAAGAEEKHLKEDPVAGAEEKTRSTRAQAHAQRVWMVSTGGDVRGESPAIPSLLLGRSANGFTAMGAKRRSSQKRAIAVSPP